VHVFAPNGKRIGKMSSAGSLRESLFGGAKKNRLVMAASQSLYSLYVNTEGAQTL